MGLRDLTAKAIVQARVESPIGGNPGAFQLVGGGVSELQIKVGPGYRGSYQQRGSVLIVLLPSGNKITQAKDSQSAAATQPSPHPQLSTLKAIQQLGP